MKKQIPLKLEVSDALLREFGDAFQAFVDAERSRLQQDKETLQALTTLSDLDTLVSATLDPALRAARKKLDALVSKRLA